MAQTQKKRSPVLFAVLLFLVASLALGAAVYFLDGVQLASQLVGKVRGLIAATGTHKGGDASSETTPVPNALTLPPGVTEEFALRLWQEEVDSQTNIGRLMDGEIRELSLGATSVAGDEASITVTAKFEDGTSAPGVLFFAKRGGKWYVRHMTGMRAADSAGMSSDTQVGDPNVPPDTPLPTLDEVDKGLLSTIFAQQLASQEVFEDYLAGNVRKVVIERAIRGPRTATIDATMYERDHVAEAQIVALKTVMHGEEFWFLAKFSKKYAAQ